MHIGEQHIMTMLFFYFFTLMFPFYLNEKQYLIKITQCTQTVAFETARCRERKEKCVYLKIVVCNHRIPSTLKLFNKKLFLDI